jgi:pteridine reductase
MNPRPVALITGAAKRVGAAIARQLHGAGYDLALHYRSAAAAMTALCRDLEARRAGSTWSFACDLADLERAEALVAGALEHYGRLDLLVNNASSFYRTPFGRITPAQFDELMASNARAPLFLSQACAPALRDQRGAIVNLVDVYAETGLVGYAPYSMAKGALLTLTRVLAQELGPEVRVNAVAPGAVLWPEDGKPYADQRLLIERAALKRAGSAEDVARAVLFLARDATFTTGQVLRVDGGRGLAV